MKTKNTTIIIAIAAALGLLISACSSDNGTTTPPATTTAASSTTVVATTAAPPTTAGDSIGGEIADIRGDHGTIIRIKAGTTHPVHSLEGDPRLEYIGGNTVEDIKTNFNQQITEGRVIIPDNLRSGLGDLTVEIWCDGNAVSQTLDCRPNTTTSTSTTEATSTSQPPTTTVATTTTTDANPNSTTTTTTTSTTTTTTTTTVPLSNSALSRIALSELTKHTDGHSPTSVRFPLPANQQNAQGALLRADTWTALQNHTINKADYPILNTSQNPEVFTGKDLTNLLDDMIYNIASFTECKAPQEQRGDCSDYEGNLNPAYHKTLAGNRQEFLDLLSNYERVLKEVLGFTVYNTCGNDIFPSITPRTSWVDYVASVAPSGSPGTTSPAVLLERVVRLDAFNLGRILASDVHEQPQMLLCAGLLFRGDLEGIRHAADLLWHDLNLGFVDATTSRANPDLFEYHVRSINDDGSLIAVARCYVGPAGGNFGYPLYRTAIYQWADGTYYETIHGSDRYSSCQLAVDGLSKTGYDISAAFGHFNTSASSLASFSYGEHKATTQTYGIDVLPRRLGLK